MRALVTGASGGIGGAIALRLAKDGYDLVLHCFSGDCEKLKSEIESFGRAADVFRADLSSTDGAERLVGFVKEKGGVDVLVNNAGMSIVDVFQSVDPAEGERLFFVNALSPMRLTQLLLPGMLRRGSGAIINISSVWGVYGGSCEVHYSASKAALIGFSKALAKELEPSGITVNCIAPGFVDTRMNAHLTEEERAEFLSGSPSGRAITPEEIAAAVSAFAENRSITGEIKLME